MAHFSRMTNRSALSSQPPLDHQNEYETTLPQPSLEKQEERHTLEDLQPQKPAEGGSLTNGSLASVASSQPRSPFGGVAMPGMADGVGTARTASPAPMSAPPPPAKKPVRPPSVFGRPTSAFGQHAPPPTGPNAIRPSPSMTEEDDPIARSLAELRRDPPPAGSIRRGHSQRRPESVVSTHPASRQSYQQPPRSPGPASSMSHNGSRQSYQGHAAGRPSMDTGLIPPMAGHTAADLARSRAEHDQRASRAFSPAPGQDYHSAAANVVGSHPASRPASPSAQPTTAPRAPSPAFMQPPAMAPSPVDEVLGQYHQAFPGERSRSRAGSFVSTHSRQQSYNAAPGQPPVQTHARSPSPAPREGFVGIGAGRSPSPQPQQFQSMHQPNMSATSPQPNMRAPSPQPNMRAPSPQPNMRAPSPQPNMRSPSPQPDVHRRGQSYSSMAPPMGSQPGITSPTSPHPANPGYGGQYPGRPGSVAGQPMTSPVHHQSYGSASGLNQSGSVASLSQPPQHYQRRDSSQPGNQNGGQVPVQHPYLPHSASSTGHGDPRYQGYQQGPVTSPPAAQTQYQSYATSNASSGAQYNNMPPYQDPRYRPGSVQPGSGSQLNQYQRSASPAPLAQSQPPYQQPGYGGYGQPQQTPQQQQQQQQPQHPPYGGSQFARGPSPAPQQINRSPSPVPPAPPADTPPTGQYSTTGEPVLFCEFAISVAPNELC
jgi:hypothetical protein